MPGFGVDIAERKSGRVDRRPDTAIKKASHWETNLSVWISLVSSRQTNAQHSLGSKNGVLRNALSRQSTNQVERFSQARNQFLISRTYRISR
jgi:hypothetical protein